MNLFKRKSLVLITGILLIAIHAHGQQSSYLLIAAASDLKFALDSLVTVFKDANREAQVEVTYGSSGKLFEQISNGAPFDIFFSADVDYPLKLKDKGMTVSEVQLYGVGRIAVWSKKIDPSTLGLNSLLNKSVVKIAIANPLHAPYGRRAEEALKNAAIYDQVKGKLVYGENISQTAQFVTAGAADAGIIALSLVLSPTMKKMQGNHYVIPENFHDPLNQGFAILKHAEKNSLALNFKDFMYTQKATDILYYFGFAKTE